MSNKNDVVRGEPLICGANFWNNEKCKKLTFARIESLDRKSKAHTKTLSGLN